MNRNHQGLGTGALGVLLRGQRDQGAAKADAGHRVRAGRQSRGPLKSSIGAVHVDSCGQPVRVSGLGAP